MLALYPEQLLRVFENKLTLLKMKREIIEKEIEILEVGIKAANVMMIPQDADAPKKAETLTKATMSQKAHANVLNERALAYKHP